MGQLPKPDGGAHNTTYPTGYYVLYRAYADGGLHTVQYNTYGICYVTYEHPFLPPPLIPPLYISLIDDDGRPAGRAGRPPNRLYLDLVWSNEGRRDYNRRWMGGKRKGKGKGRKEKRGREERGGVWSDRIVGEWGLGVR